MKKNILNIIKLNAERNPEKLVFGFLNGKGDLVDSVTNKELLYKVIHRASIISSKTETGDRVAILLNSSIDYIVSFLACIWAGTIAVPLYPIKKNKVDSRLKNVFKDCSPSLFLCNGVNLLKAEELYPNIEDNIHEISTEDIGDTIKKSSVAKEFSIAFLQYTSGSISIPKGVMISHENLMAHADSIDISYQLVGSDISLSWLPFYHDMGLVSGIVQTIFSNMSLYFMEPLSFIKRPLLWLKAIERYEITSTGGPNFAFSLVLKALLKNPDVSFDLKSLNRFFCGAEPIEYKIMQRVQMDLEHFGLDPNSIFSCYGMAESTLQITGNGYKKPLKKINISRESLMINEFKIVEESSPAKIEIVSCGIPYLDTKVFIVDPITLDMSSENAIGEIWVNGSILSKGYWNKPEETKQAFHNNLGELKNVFRTGDLGFLHKGLLYVTGRIKEMIIINGSNYYPFEIEKFIQSLSSNYNERGVYCFMNTTNQLVVGVEVSRAAIAIFDKELNVERIKTSIFSEFNLGVEDVFFSRPMSLPKTSSGKKQRLKAANMYLVNQLNLI